MQNFRYFHINIPMLPCPKLSKLESEQGKEIILWIIDTVAKYNECSALNDVINEALN